MVPGTNRIPHSKTNQSSALRPHQRYAKHWIFDFNFPCDVLSWRPKQQLLLLWAPSLQAKWCVSVCVFSTKTVRLYGIFQQRPFRSIAATAGDSVESKEIQEDLRAVQIHCPDVLPAMPVSWKKHRFRGGENVNCQLSVLGSTWITWV